MVKCVQPRGWPTPLWPFATQSRKILDLTELGLGQRLRVVRPDRGTVFVHGESAGRVGGDGGTGGKSEACRAAEFPATPYPIKKNIKFVDLGHSKTEYIYIYLYITPNYQLLQQRLHFYEIVFIIIARTTSGNASNIHRVQGIDLEGTLRVVNLCTAVYNSNLGKKYQHFWNEPILVSEKPWPHLLMRKLGFDAHT